MKRIRGLHFVEFISAATVLLWGLIIANPFLSHFEIYAVSYSDMGRLAPEWVWGLSGIIIGGVSLYGLFTSRKRLRILGLSAIAAFRIFQLVFIILRTSWTTPGLPDFTAWVLLALIALDRVSNGLVE